MEYIWTIIWMIIIFLGIGILILYLYQQHLISKEYSISGYPQKNEEIIDKYHMDAECSILTQNKLSTFQKLIRRTESFIVYIGLGRLFFLQVVPSEQAWVIDRYGVDRVACEGINRIIPGLDKIDDEDKLDLREQESDPDPQTITTKDNIKIDVDMYATFRIIHPMKTVKEVDDYVKKLEKIIENSTYIILTGQNFIDIQKNTETLLSEIKKHVEATSMRWGIKMMEVSFQSLTPPEELVAAEQKKIIAEKEKEADIITANGKHQVMVLQAESERVLIEKRAEATRKAIEELQRLMPNLSDEKLMNFLTSTAYIDSMKELSKSTNSKFVLYPSDVQQPIDKVMNAEYLSRHDKK